MNREKQIEEMAEIICDARQRSVYSNEIAEALYNAGYRKQNAVIDEFAERLKEEMENLTRMVYSDKTVYLVGKSLIDRIAEEMKGGTE